MNANEALAEIDRIHDDDPQHAASGLRTLDANALDADRLPLFAFLLNHVLGEKSCQWHEAADRLALLCTRSDTPPAVRVHAAVAAKLGGVPRSAAYEVLVQEAGETAAALAVELGALGFADLPAPDALAERLNTLAGRARLLIASGPLDVRIAVGFNNVTSRLLDLATDPVDPRLHEALVNGSDAALHFWLRAGTWVQHERALYLQALVYNRLGEPAQARRACEEALVIIETNGGEPIDRAFVQLQLAAALLRLRETAAANAMLAEADAAAAAWDDAGLKSWFAGERSKHFGKREGTGG